MVNTSVWATSPLGVAVRHVFCVFFSSRLWCPRRFQNSPHRSAGERVSWCLETSSFTTPSPGWVSVPNSFVSPFVFYILSYLLLKRMGCLSGCLVSSASVQKLFRGSCSAFKWSFGEFVGGESGLPVLFLRHLRTAPSRYHFRLSHKGRLQKREGFESKCLRRHPNLRNS